MTVNEESKWSGTKGTASYALVVWVRSGDVTKDLEPEQTSRRSVCGTSTIKNFDEPAGISIS